MTSGRIERRLAAVLAADVAGYSRLMGADEVGTLQALKRLRREIVDPAIASHKGRIVKTTGDGLLVEFASAVDAVTCAMAVQGQMAERESETQIKFRIGINVGDIIIDDGDIFGDGVNVAARVENECEPGGVCLSGGAYEHVRGKTDFAFIDLGERSLKNIERPVRLYSTASSNGTEPQKGAVKALPLPDKPSIAVLPFQNMSGDPEQEYFADGMVEDIITELSRFREFAVIARNSTFFYKNKPLDVMQIARDLRVNYVLEGSVRRIGNRVRVTAQLIDAVNNEHVWAERYDRDHADMIDVQDEITRTVVASIAPEINLAEIARSRRETANPQGKQLAWRAEGMFIEAYQSADGALMQQAISVCQEAISADPKSLAAHSVLAMAFYLCHLYRWGSHPETAVAQAWNIVERMSVINSQDERTLTLRGWVRFNRGEYEGGLADMRRAREVNPNYAFAVIALAFAEAKAGMANEAIEHADIALRLSPRDYWAGTAHLAMALAHFTSRNYAETIRWCESGIQVSHRAPIRRALMIACCAQNGGLGRARVEIDALNGFAPGFLTSLMVGDNPVFIRPEDNAHLLESLRIAGIQ
ncbi:adenylate/guanylate cyclase domain-containing protein [Bradyrhizobium sp. OAE829]|uniref:adenylate/guanylate cyclase domain-containing protein n=1 Tax=Bradyrhizobium sp. OAE829 TaxID=2663807 RepID=UPI0019FC4417